MTAAPAVEAARREALRGLHILDTPPEPDFDALARLAAHVCGTPIALLTLLDGERQWFKAHVGVDITETPREYAFCDPAVETGDLFVVPDAAADARFADNPLVTGAPFARFYAGAPLVTARGIGLGTLCVVDREPRTLTPEQEDALRMLARQAVGQLELRRHARQVEALEAEQRAEAERTARTQAALTELARLDKSDLDRALRGITRVAARTLGVERVGIWMFEDGGRALRCASLHRLSDDAHESGARISAGDAPAYFAALRESPLIAAEDAQTDPRTREFAEGYLRPQGIGAMLDVPVWRDGQVAGVLCHEHVGGPRAWNHEEQDLAGGAAAMATLALESAERSSSEAAARRTAARMRAVARAAAGVLAADTEERLRSVVADACARVLPAESVEFRVDGRAAPRGTLPLAVPVVPHPTDGDGDAAAAPPAAAYDGGRMEMPVVGAGGRALGTLHVRGAPGVAYGPDDRQVVDALASLAAVALEGIRAEEALRASEESYRTIFELASDAVFVHDPETGAVLDANRQACELHGCSLERLREIGIPGISDGKPPYNAAQALARVHAAAAGTPQRFEWLVRDAAGAPVWVEVSLHGVTIRGAPRVLASVRNINERKAAEEALRRLNDELEARVDARTAELAETNMALEEEVAERTAAEEELRQKTHELEAVFRTLPDLYFRLDRDGILRDYAGPSRDALFIPCADCVGRRSDDVFPPALARAVAEGRRELARTGELVCIEDVLPLPDGERHFEARLLPFLDAQTIVIVRDITDRARAERALQASEEHFRRLIENSSDVATILDPSGVNLYQSPAIERVFGYSVDEMLGTSAFERIHPDDRDRARETLGGILQAPGTTVSVEIRYRHADGSWRWIDAQGRTLLPDSADAGIVINVRDVTERRQAQEALRRSESLFRSTVDSVSDVIAIIDGDGMVRLESAAAERVFGYRTDEVVGRPAFDRVHPDDLPAVRRAFRRLVDNPGETVTMELRMRRADGSWVEVESTGRALSPTSAEEGVVVSTRDITERKRWEERIRRSELRFRSVVENTSDLVTLMEPDGTIGYQSPSIERMFGYGREELVGTSAFDMVHPDDLAGVLERFGEVLQNPGEPRAAAFRFRDRAGAWRFVESVASTLSPTGPGDGVVVNTRDVTARREQELALDEARRFLENLVASSPGVIFRGSGRDFTTTWISPNARSVLGFSAEAFLRDPHLWVARTHPDDRAAVDEKLQAALARGAGELTYEYRFLHGCGEYRTLLASARFQPAGAAQEMEVVGYTLDVTPLKEAEAALRAAMEEAQAAREAAETANRAKSEFLSRMSHELRTPMNSILGFAQLLARRDPTPEQRRSVDQILRAGGHLLNLINEVLDIARIESNRQPLSLEPVAVDTAVAEAVSLIRPLSAEFEVRLQEPETAPGVHLRADRQRLAQILLNLLSNAIKYNRAGGSVRVSVDVVPPPDAGGTGAVRIAVHDTGRGIPPEVMGELFVPFARLGAEQTGVEGTGLGLALSQRLAEAMGGSLTAESEPGTGSTFTLQLPAAADPLARLDRRAASPASGAGTAEAAPGREATLLYVEDNLANLALIETLLSTRRELTLLTAMQGRMGMYLAWEQAPDLVLLDLHLPDVPGDEVLRQLRADPRTARTRIVVISADATPGRMERLREAGADAYLTKPLDLDVFLETLDRMLEPEERP